MTFGVGTETASVEMCLPKVAHQTNVNSSFSWKQVPPLSIHFQTFYTVRFSLRVLPFRPLPAQSTQRTRIKTAAFYLINNLPGSLLNIFSLRKNL